LGLGKSPTTSLHRLLIFPASKGTTVPVTYRASSDTSHTTAFDTSMGSTASTGIAFCSQLASSGACSMMAATFPSGAIGERTVVGATLVTRMKYGAR
jgi:hypothetical protein